MAGQKTEARSPEALAEEHFQTALEIGRHIANPDDIREMTRLFKAALHLDPEGHSHVRGHLAWNYYYNNQFEAAARTYLEILAESPSEPDAQYYGGLSLLRCGKKREATTWLLRSARTSFPAKRAWNALALGLFYKIPNLTYLYQAYRFLVWWIGAILIQISDIVRGRKQFSTGAYMRWCLGNWPAGAQYVSYARAYEIEFAFSRLDPSPDAVVLDIGSGDSPFIPFAATRGVRMIGSDLDVSVGAAKKVCPPVREGKLDDRLLLVQADGTRLPFADGSLRWVVSISVIEHIPSDGDLLMMKEVARVLAPGGRAVITTEGASQASTCWILQPFYVGHQYDRVAFDDLDDDSEGFLGFYRWYDPEDLVLRLGTVDGLELVESGFLVDRFQLRGHFPDKPSSSWEKIIHPWKSLIGHFSFKPIKIPLPPNTGLHGAVGYVVLEKPEAR